MTKDTFRPEPLIVADDDGLQKAIGSGRLAPVSFADVARAGAAVASARPRSAAYAQGLRQAGAYAEAEAIDPSRPIERRDSIIDAVREDLHRRSQLGIVKYGTTLGENPAALKERLQHAYEEALDLANYLKWSITQLEEQGH